MFNFLRFSRLAAGLIMKSTTLLLGHRPSAPQSFDSSQLTPQIFGESSAALETNLRLCSHFPVKTSKLGLLKSPMKKDRTPSLCGSGPFSSSQLRTGTGETSWATLASGLYSNIDIKIKTSTTKQNQVFLNIKKFHNCGPSTETEKTDSGIRYSSFGETLYSS